MYSIRLIVRAITLFTWNVTVRDYDWWLFSDDFRYFHINEVVKRLYLVMNKPLPLEVISQYIPPVFLR